MVMVRKASPRRRLGVQACARYWASASPCLGAYGVRLRCWASPRRRKASAGRPFACGGRHNRGRAGNRGRGRETEEAGGKSRGKRSAAGNRGRQVEESCIWHPTGPTDRFGKRGKEEAHLDLAAAAANPLRARASAARGAAPLRVGSYPLPASPPLSSHGPVLPAASSPSRASHDLAANLHRA
ncbi:unnamed protein product [Urochloa humidicola]